MIVFFGGLVAGIVVCCMSLSLLRLAILQGRQRRIRQAMSYRLAKLAAVDYSHS